MRRFAPWWGLFGLVVVTGTAGAIYLALWNGEPALEALQPDEALHYRPRQSFDSSGNIPVTRSMEQWPPEASLDFYTLWGAVRLAVLIGKARAGVRSGQLRDLGLVYVSEHFMPRFISRVAEMMGRLLAR